MTMLSKQRTTNPGEGVGKGEQLLLLMGIETGAATGETNTKRSPNDQENYSTAKLNHPVCTSKAL